MKQCKFHWAALRHNLTVNADSQHYYIHIRHEFIHSKWTFFNEYDCVERALLFWDRHVWIEVKLLDKNKYRIKSIHTPFKFKCLHRTTFSILLFSTSPSFFAFSKALTKQLCLKSRNVKCKRPKLTYMNVHRTWSAKALPLELHLRPLQPLPPLSPSVASLHHRPLF